MAVAGPWSTCTATAAFGGAGGQEDGKGEAGTPGVAGNGNQIIFTLGQGATLTGSALGVGAVIFEADGGHGGNAGNGTSKLGDVTAPGGTIGGNGGTITATINGTVVSGGSAIVAHANGGVGGSGGSVARTMVPAPAAGAARAARAAKWA